jgi:hypothetical protein
MAILGQWFVLLHIVSAIVLIAGLIGRGFTRAYARHQEQLDIFVQFLGLSRWFVNKLISPGSHAVLIFGLLAAWTRGWPIFGFLQGSPVNWVFVSLLLYLTTIPLVFFIFIPRGKIFNRELAEAQSQGLMTAELRVAMDDPVVRAAYFYEAAVVAVIVYLMVMKPF